eukprot:6490891-Amphidinium_carterae.3
MCAEGSRQRIPCPSESAAALSGRASCSTFLRLRDECDSPTLAFCPDFIAVQVLGQDSWPKRSVSSSILFVTLWWVVGCNITTKMCASKSKEVTTTLERRSWLAAKRKALCNTNVRASWHKRPALDQLFRM